MAAKSVLDRNKMCKQAIVNTAYGALGTPNVRCAATQARKVRQARSASLNKFCQGRYPRSSLGHRSLLHAAQCA